MIMNSTYPSSLGQLLRDKLESEKPKNVAYGSNSTKLKNILLNLANTQIPKVDEFDSLLGDSTEGMNAEINEALKEIKAEERKATIKAAATQITEMSRKADDTVIIYVKNIRDARAWEKTALANLKELQTRKEYAKATGNYLPLAAFMGMVQNEENNPLYSVQATTAKRTTKK